MVKFLGQLKYTCVWDKVSIGATDEWCQEGYDGTGLCNGSGCQKASSREEGYYNRIIVSSRFDNENILFILD